MGIIRLCLIGLFFTLIVCFAFSAFAFAATEEINVILKAGENEVRITPTADVLDAPYAGVQFGLKISDDKALKFTRFNLTADLRKVNALIYAPTFDDAKQSFVPDQNGVYFFGFTDDPQQVSEKHENQFSGSMAVGTAVFEYTGNSPATITITEMKVARIVKLEGKEDWVSKFNDNVLKEPLYIIHVSRASSTESTTGGGTGGDVDIKTKETGTLPTGVEDGPTSTGPKAPVITPFIEGFEDSTFRGQTQMTREQFVTILARLKNDGEVPAAGGTETFADVAKSKWSYDAIEWAFTAGIIEPNSEGKFRPAEPLTRAEMAVMFVKAEKLTGVAENKFSDLGGHAAATDILKAVDVGIFTGYEDGTFRPDGSTTRYEAVTALVRYLLGGEPQDSMWQGAKLSFSDTPVSNWAYKYVVLAVGQ